MLKLTYITFFSLISITSLHATSVDGKIFYELPSGDLVDRAVSIDVPSRGIGEVVLSGKRIEWKSSNFSSEQVNGRMVFTVAFKTEFREFKSTMVLKGTYIKAKNKILYYGDLYKRNGHIEFQNDLTDFEHTGGFSFKFDRD